MGRKFRQCLVRQDWRASPWRSSYASISNNRQLAVFPLVRNAARFETSRLARLAAFAGALVLSFATHAAPTVPTAPIGIANGNFSDPANNGSIGGGLVGGSGSATIGSGPWSGSYAGALGLLAPPLLTIASGKAQIGDCSV